MKREALLERVDPDYNVLHTSWNTQPSKTLKSYRVVLFEDRPSSESFKRERFLYEQDPIQTGLKEMENQETKQNQSRSLLKVPIKQLLTNLAEKEVAEEAAKTSTTAEITAEKSSSSSNIVTGPKKKFSDLYSPKDYQDLIGNEMTNRFSLKWLQSWDYKVFGKVL